MMARATHLEDDLRYTETANRVVRPTPRLRRTMGLIIGFLLVSTVPAGTTLKFSRLRRVAATRKTVE
jgi:hypothetical protein